MHQVEFKSLFLKSLEKCCGKEKEIAVPLSAGVDSNSIMFGLLELGKTPVTYSFHVEGILSRDFLCAQASAKEFGVKFVECVIPQYLDMTVVQDLITNYNRRKKADIESLYPFYYLLNKVNEKVLLTGAYTEGYFGNTKRVKIHFSQTLAKMQEFRKKYFAQKEYNIYHTLGQIANDRYKIKVDAPYKNDELYDFFWDKDWPTLNKPRQKETIRKAFDEQFARIKVYPQTGLQCHDSGIRELFLPLLKDPCYNRKRRIRLMDVYRDLHARKHSITITDFL